MLLSDPSPYFEDFSVGQLFGAPRITLTSGQAAVYQAMFGDRLRLPLDAVACRDVCQGEGILAHPGLVLNTAIGQSTHASQNVRANLFYRQLVLLRPVFIGESLETRTQVVALRQNSPRPGRPATGQVLLEIETLNQRGEQILHFWRCPMIPCRDPTVATGHADAMDGIAAAISARQWHHAVPDWDIAALPVGDMPRPLPSANAEVQPEVTIEAADTVTCAPELARLTLNMARTHTDAEVAADGRRLVYGGYSISVALAQLSRAIPAAITWLGLGHCDHIAPVYEGDRLYSSFRVDSTMTAPQGILLQLAVQTFAKGPDGEREVLNASPCLWAQQETTA